MNNEVKLVYVKEPHNEWFEIKEDNGETLKLLDINNTTVIINKKEVVDETYV